MSKESSEKISQDRDFKGLVDEFAQYRKSQGISHRQISDDTSTGVGRVGQFEKLNHNPSLLTFIKWCRSVGLTIKLIDESNG